MSEDESLQAEIHALLDQVQSGSETVQQLAFDCLRHFRKECGSIFEQSQRDTAEHLLTTGSGEGFTEINSMRDERLTQARKNLKERLEALLKTAKDKGL